jgi:hypothetical protein
MLLRGLAKGQTHCAFWELCFLGTDFRFLIPNPQHVKTAVNLRNIPVRVY